MEFVLREKKILIAEDDPDHAELIIDELYTGDIKKEIILMKNGQEVIDYFQEADIDSSVRVELEIDLIILDLNLPKVHGMDVLKFLKNHPTYSSIPIIIFSTSPDSKTISEVYKNGANSFITKPTSFNEFRENINQLRKYC
jgi:DNA-binding response OmpR family regulator